MPRVNLNRQPNNDKVATLTGFETESGHAGICAKTDLNCAFTVI